MHRGTIMDLFGIKKRRAEALEQKKQDEKFDNMMKAQVKIRALKIQKKKQDTSYNDILKKCRDAKIAGDTNQEKLLKVHLKRNYLYGKMLEAHIIQCEQQINQSEMMNAVYESKEAMKPVLGELNNRDIVKDINKSVNESAKAEDNVNSLMSILDGDIERMIESPDIDGGITDEELEKLIDNSAADEEENKFDIQLNDKIQSLEKKLDNE